MSSGLFPRSLIAAQSAQTVHTGSREGSWESSVFGCAGFRSRVPPPELLVQCRGGGALVLGSQDQCGWGAVSKCGQLWGGRATREDDLTFEAAWRKEVLKWTFTNALNLKDE